MLASITEAEVDIHGVEGEVYDNVRLILSIEKEQCNAPKWKIQNLVKKSTQEIDQGLRAFGYYHSTSTSSLAFNKECWNADFTINPGPRVTVDKVEVVINGDAKDDPDFSTLLTRLPIKLGAPLHHGNYESTKSKIAALALEKGYLKANFIEKKLIVDKQRNTAHIRLAFESGMRLKIGDITIQQDILDAAMVQKYLTIKSGDFYVGEDLANTYSALTKSGYFDSVDIRSELDNIQDGRVPVIINLTAKKRSHYGLGLGFDTDIGPLINANYINRRINRYGHVFSANLDLSPVLSTVEVEYSIPLAKPTTDYFSFGGWLKREETKTFESMSATLSTRLKHAFANNWRQTLFVDWTYEDFKSDSDSGQIVVLAPGGNWLISVADNPVRPTKGYRIEAEVKGSVENPISDVSIWTPPVLQAKIAFGF